MTFEEILQTEHTLVYKNKGTSMLPWIHSGKDIIIIESIVEPLKKYDAVLFKRGDGYVLHRIMKLLDDNTYYIIGDNTIKGEIVKQDQIIGILTSIKQPNRTIYVNDFSYKLKVRCWWLFIWPLLTFYRKLKRK